MKSYELTYLITSSVSEEDAEVLAEKITTIITEGGGIVDQRISPIRKKLGYPINDNSEAFLATLYFKMAGNDLQELEKKVKEEKQILRYLLLVKKKIKEKAKRKPRIIKEEPKAEKSEKVEVKEFDKKMEEILS